MSSGNDEEEEEEEEEDSGNVYVVLGGGKLADLFLWRNKKVSGGVLVVATAIWVLFEVIECHLLTIACYVLLVGLTGLFIWSNATTFIKKSPLHVPDILISDRMAVNAALTLRFEINRATFYLRSISLGHDINKFLVMVAGLGILSVIGDCFNLLTLLYIAFILLHTVPLLYEKYEDKINIWAERLVEEVKRFYAVFDANFLSKIPRKTLNDKMQ